MDPGPGGNVSAAGVSRDETIREDGSDAPLYGDAGAALRKICESFEYWTEKITESSFAATFAVIGANWAVFGSFRGIRANACSIWSVAVVLLGLALNLLGQWLLGEMLRRRVSYAEEDSVRWRKEYEAAKGSATAWPSTPAIDNLAWGLRIIKTFLPLVGGALFISALFAADSPVAQKNPAECPKVSEAIVAEIHSMIPNRPPQY